MIKLQSVKLGYSVRAGTKEDVFFHDSQFNIYLDSRGMVHLQAKSGGDWTHVFQTNIAWFKSPDMDKELSRLEEIESAPQKKQTPPQKTKTAPEATRPIL
jgi:hypothetical protein